MGGVCLLFFLFFHIELKQVVTGHMVTTPKPPDLPKGGICETFFKLISNPVKVLFTLATLAREAR
jgi:hypothetical protein